MPMPFGTQVRSKTRQMRHDHLGWKEFEQDMENVADETYLEDFLELEVLGANKLQAGQGRYVLRVPRAKGASQVVTPVPLLDGNGEDE
jgi:hypothetical protein